MDKNSKLGKFIAGKGFYAALAICLIGAGAASWIAVDKTLSGLEKKNLNTESQSAFFEASGSTADVGKNRNDVPKPVTPDSSDSRQTSSVPPASSAPDTQETDLPVQQKQYFMLPVNGEIQQEYSNRELVKSVTMGDWRTHDGVDIACEANTVVRSFSDGKVKSIADDELWGKVVKIEHDNGYVSVYCGLSDHINVKEGETVEIGKVIGTTGPTSLIEVAQEPHLHFEVQKNGKTVDPVKLIAEQ